MGRLAVYAGMGSVHMLSLGEFIALLTQYGSVSMHTQGDKAFTLTGSQYDALACVA